MNILGKKVSPQTMDKLTPENLREIFVKLQTVSGNYESFKIVV